ncbi:MULTISPECIES: glutamate--cysteine ligase [unclassified Chelatococcus]|uniref:glutamate--cysteine ligase n=1 Tax=unclassified Chelatococcus TaxID=2638111 RepID=UPI001BCD97D9|nr:MULTISPECIES: glutamate--cysteine ligase [unclassified Chelatococcus]CAH1649040.1 Glutamate--cysteine ligase [Hyphomicrobiales bacterium]MBS7739552.1 glutamate--cysteine ligase [Chelatococcus sp. HY11]MBX3543921.1 glutamate--cysteine ligase [Chelatococcus sp.]MCO5075911.1 glutamate--cysteine ligase [Chelatococcus sp.]CAH1667722.1 Glutamate--cysteine ligase [Hyphomicrobiales bacterium]
MARDSSNASPIASRDELIAYIAEGAKPAEQWRIGTEHEKVPFYVKDNRPVPYDGPRGIRALLDGMQGLLGWRPIMEGDHPIGLEDVTGGGAISLEPGGQFELSGAPLTTLHQMSCETQAHLAQVREVAEPLGIGFLTLGMSPLWSLDETPVMPKGRYEIMRRYMPKVGQHGLDMMFRTATVQVNLDFASEADMVQKLRIGLALQPLATALFANSPFTEGRPNGFQSMRSRIWLDTDADRTGMLPFAFEEGMGYERYVDWALDVPMYFVKRGDTYHDVTGASFKDLMAGRLAALPGERATLSDWANHLSTLFPEVRLKRYLEMRGADTGSTPFLCALPAFWVGLLYDEVARDAAWQLVKNWSNADRETLRRDVPAQGLAATVAGRPLREVAREVLQLSRAGLVRRGRRDVQGRDEAHFLDIVDEVVATGENAAQRMLARYADTWRETVEPVFKTYVY